MKCKKTAENCLSNIKASVITCQSMKPRAIESGSIILLLLLFIILPFVSSVGAETGKPKIKKEVTMSKTGNGKLQLLLLF